MSWAYIGGGRYINMASVKMITASTDEEFYTIDFIDGGCIETSFIRLNANLNELRAVAETHRKEVDIPF